MKIKEIIFHLSNVYDGRPWYGNNMVDIIGGSDDDNPRINRILAHMLAWRHFAINKVKGNDFSIEINSEVDWPKEALPNRKEAIQAFNHSNKELFHELQQKSDDWMREKVQGTEYNFQFLLEGIVQHDIYHLGQIAILQKEGHSGTSGIQA